MASLLSSQLLIFSLFCLSAASSPPSLLALNCSSPSLQRPPLQSLFSNLTSQVAKTRFIDSTNMMGFHGLIMQCRLDLSPTRCTICAQNAVRTVSTLCPYSNSGTAWFDGCYLQYHHRFSPEDFVTSTNISCSSQIHVLDQVQFELALETLFLRLRAEINLATHHQFSSGELTYGNHSKVYGLAECVRFMSPEECEACVAEGVERLHKHCGGKDGGTVVAGNCVVRFEVYQFFSYIDAGGSESGGGTDDVGTRITEGGGSMCFKAKVALAWGVVVACLIGIVLSAWLMRRSVVNTAKVATFGYGDDKIGRRS
ncbi:cysteine-rich repeat secretory protein 38-like [Vitis riparia]|uniref:cysteine-rich repeat secretory protein 38-like n=1 Tax=Vitis riparia TaxID=96939 RepID=UPI00155ADC08|nr:cysteine-rich repeat secretory protein 38-like [Vitis riparia]